MCVLVAQSFPILCDSTDYSLPDSSVRGILQAVGSGEPFPSPEDLPNPGIKLRSPALQADSLTSEPPRKPLVYHIYYFLSIPFMMLLDYEYSSTKNNIFLTH